MTPYALVPVVLILIAIMAFPNWWKWFWTTGDEIQPFRFQASDSFIMLMIGASFWLLRRLSIWENFKHIIPGLDPHKRTPAWATDLYAIFQWTLIGLLPLVREHLSTNAFVGLIVYIIVEILQSCIYHNLWRIHLFPRDHVMGTGHHAFRTLFMSFVNFLAICVLYGQLYLTLESNTDKIKSTLDAVYFSIVVGATVGFGDISPLDDLGKYLCMSQIIVSIIMITIVVGQSIGTLGSIFEKKVLPSTDSGGRDQTPSTQLSTEGAQNDQ